ncbi:uncharacterized protein [Montipora capricornis]|uniref:uncharacterized protein n=1 Tax=Montipora capricornis TaxID=246305 RepID=UPI0035F13B60
MSPIVLYGFFSEIERAHRTGRPTRHDGTPKPRTVVCKFTSYKAKESILKAARRMKPEGIHIFEDLAEETMEKRRAQLPQLRQAKAQGKIAYFSLDRLIIKDRPNGSAITDLDGVSIEDFSELVIFGKGKDVFAVLPTGFGKSLIYQSYAFARNVLDGRPPIILVITPLRSIVQEQLKNNEFELKAAELTLQDDFSKDVRDGNTEVLYASAENALNQKFLSVVRDPSSELRRRSRLKVVDESHTVYTWGKESKGKKAFREDYSSLSVLRSFCGGIPVLALTGTADDKMVKKIKGQLAMSRTTSTIVAVTSKTKHQALGDFLYESGKSHHPSNRLVGIYHAHTFPKYKDRVLSSFKSLTGTTRVIIATSALGMGVNFPDVKYIVHAGPERSLVDYIQAAGRAGRNGEPAHDVVIYHGNQLAQCDPNVKEFVRANGCIREALFKHFSDNVKQIQPLHQCCSNCTKFCNCCHENCKQNLPFLKPIAEKQNSSNCRGRTVTPEERNALKEALIEEKASLDAGKQSVFDVVTTHGFSEELIKSITENCQHIFTIDYLMENFPIFNFQHAVTILEYIHEVFKDVPAITELVSIVSNSHFDMQSFTFDLFNYEGSGNSQCEDEDWVNDKELENT